MARPTVYNKSILDKANDYLLNYVSKGDAIPSIAGLACELQISRTTIYDWAKHDDKQEFSYILANILSKQERVLMNSGLNGEFNSAIVKLALGKHGYSDKQETDITSGGEKVKNEWHIHPVTNNAE